MDKNILKEFFEKQMIPLWSVAGLTKDDSVFLPKNLQGRFTSAVVYAFPLSDAVLDLLSGGPDLLYLHHYRQVNYLLDRVGILLSELLRQNGFSGLPVPTSQVIDWKEQKGLLSLRRIATTSGLGWIGRNNLLVNPGLGSRFRLVTVLTDMPLETGPSLDFSCGNCRACISPCPAQAIHENPADFDHGVCYEKLDEFRRKHIVSQHICGVCVKACRGPKA